MLEREQKSSTNISPVEEQIYENEEESFSEEENLGNHLEEENQTSESGIVRTGDSSKSTQVEENEIIESRSQIHPQFSSHVDSSSGASYQTPKLYLTHTDEQ